MDRTIRITLSQKNRIGLRKQFMWEVTFILKFNQRNQQKDIVCHHTMFSREKEGQKNRRSGENDGFSGNTTLTKKDKTTGKRMTFEGLL